MEEHLQLQKKISNTAKPTNKLVKNGCKHNPITVPAAANRRTETTKIQKIQSRFDKSIGAEFDALSISTVNAISETLHVPTRKGF